LPLAHPGLGGGQGCSSSCNNNPTRRRPTISQEKTLQAADLRHFTGSDHWYRHGLNRDVTFTDGAKFLVDAGGAYWPLDEIAPAQRYESKFAREAFQLWKLRVNADRSAMLVCENGNGTEVGHKLSPVYEIPGEELVWLVERVKVLQEGVATICHERLSV
jgi:hypothetical protein